MEYNVVIVGATGAVGQELLKILDERKFPLRQLKLCATIRSAGKEIIFKGQKYIVEETKADSFKNMDIALFAGGKASLEFASDAVQHGCVVIDNSSNYRMDPKVPLVVPEVNPEDVKNHQGIIANPNCSTIIMAVPLKPIHDAAKIKRIIVSTYQAVSGAGKEGIEELTEQTRAVLNGQEYAPNKFMHQIAFNLIPHIDIWQDQDYTKEEMKMVLETQKILHNDNIKIAATTVRVPIYRSHSESINIETEKKLTAEEVKQLLSKAPGVIVQDDPTQNIYPMPLYSADHDEVFVGRIREDISHPSAINLWVVGDQIRKGAATNAVQIAELVIKHGCLMEKK